MKITELMVRDWVIKPSGHILPMWSREFSNANEWFKDVRPIQLTSEILEHNGWWCNETREWFNEGAKCYLAYNFGNYCLNGESTITITYVHEFQHALRLCGSQELADHFRVK